MRLFLGSAQRPAARRHRLAGAAAACLCAAVAATPLSGAATASAAPAGLIARGEPRTAHSPAPGPGAGQAGSGSGSSQSGDSSSGSGSSGSGSSGSGSSGSGSSGSGSSRSGGSSSGSGSGSNGSAGPASTRTATVGGARLAGRGVIVSYPAHGARRLPKVKASAYVVADAGTGQVLAAKDPHGLYRPASTLKVLTAIALMPVLNPDAAVVASRRAANQIPSKVGLVQGNRYQVSALFKALLMISANDAAVALAQATGSYAKGMAVINAEAHHLQAYDTVAVRPNGLDAPGQHVSAYDEALFARQALAVPAFMHDEALRKFRFQLRPHGTRHHPRWENLWTQNSMLYTFPGDLGGKIGWTTPAGATFIGWARRGHTTLVVTILHCPPGTELTVASRLLNWGFAMDGKVGPVGQLVSPLPSVAAHPRITLRPAVHLKRALPARTDLPAISLAVGFGALLIAVVTTTAIMLIGGRRRRAGNPPSPPGG
jgi:serine-type D-Ala-D-Ala carboxypeptidase (penicillin-binding protein 5/6)